MRATAFFSEWRAGRLTTVLARLIIRKMNNLQNLYDLRICFNYPVRQGQDPLFADGKPRQRKRVVFETEREAQAFALGIGWEAREGEVIDVFYGPCLDDSGKWYAQPGWGDDLGLPVTKINFEPRIHKFTPIVELMPDKPLRREIK